MRLPRLSVAKLMVLVLCLAFNFFPLRQFFINGETLGETILGVLFMANVLAFGTYRILYRCAETRFNKGFVGFGLVAVFAYLGCLAMLPEAMTRLLGSVIKPFAKFYDGPVTSLVASSSYQEELGIVFLIPIFLAASATLALPQLVFALLGGWLYHSSKLVRRDGRPGFDSRGLGPS